MKKVFYFFAASIMMLMIACNESTVEVLPDSSQTINKLIYYCGSMLRNDSIIVDSGTIHYIGRIYNPSKGLILLDTFFVDEVNSNTLLSSVSSEILWNTQGNLPDIKYSEQTVFILTMRNKNYKERTIKFYQKIPEIDNLIKQFEQLSLKIFN